MKFGITKRASFVAGSAAAAATFALPDVVRAQSTSVKIGYIDSFSGPLADIGQHQRKGLQVAIDELNRRGAVRFEPLAGYPYEMVLYSVGP